MFKAITRSCFYLSIIHLQLVSFVCLTDDIKGSETRGSFYLRGNENHKAASGEIVVANAAIFVAADKRPNSKSTNGYQHNPDRTINKAAAVEETDQRQLLELLQDSQFDDNLSGQPINLQKFQQDNSLSAIKLPFLSQLTEQDESEIEKRQVGEDQQQDKLNSSFLDLFHDLWEIKNRSRITLVRLEYFKKIQLNNHSAENVTSNSSMATVNFRLPGRQMRPPSVLFSKPNVVQRNETTFGKLIEAPTMNRANNTNNGQQPNRVINQVIKNMGPASSSTNLPGVGKNNQQWILSALGIRIHNWILLIQSKVNRLVSSLSMPLTNKQVALVSQPTRHANVRSDEQNHSSDEPGGDEITKVKADKGIKAPVLNSSQKPPERLIIKRQALDSNKLLLNGERETQTTSDMPMSKAKQCIELDLNQKSKCKTTSASIYAKLNNTFPGTLSSIEDSCKQIQILLGTCWPKQLEHISSSLSSWNESLRFSTDFPLPSPTSKTRLQANDETSGSTSCGVEPDVTDIVLDRISWMWLNLCMDKKFRQDYVDNLSCLRLWTQERANSLCPNEYKRMQANLDVSSEMIAKVDTIQQQSPQNEPNKLKTTTQGSTTTQLANRAAERPFEGLDRELESKTLCCMFDLFLRCVHRQAVRDCGRSGGQFVVSFLSRIGTDDMKYLCNGEPRTNNNQRAKQQHVSRKGNVTFEKGPFIESNYCSEPRIHAALHGLSNEVSQDKISVSAKPRPLNSKNRPTNIDPAFFGNESTDSETNSGSRIDLSFFYLIIPWTFAFSFHTWFLAYLIRP